MLERILRCTRKVLLKKVNGEQDKGGSEYKAPIYLIEGRDYLTMEVSNVSVEFEDGNIKNIFADLVPINRKGEKGFPVRFRNNKPIPVSSKFDPEMFEFNKIYAGKPCEVYRFVRNRGIETSNKMQWDESINAATNCQDLFFLLSDLLEYMVVAESDKEDYSPANRVYDLNEQNPVQQCKKEKRSKILLVKAYSDFIGIRDDQPNGLIQFEASKKINILTAREQLNKTLYHGFITFMEPAITFSKLEHNNKYL